MSPFRRWSETARRSPPPLARGRRWCRPTPTPRAAGLPSQAPQLVRQPLGREPTPGDRRLAEQDARSTEPSDILSRRGWIRFRQTLATSMCRRPEPRALLPGRRKHDARLAAAEPEQAGGDEPWPEHRGAAGRLRSSRRPCWRLRAAGRRRPEAIGSGDGRTAVCPSDDTTRRARARRGESIDRARSGRRVLSFAHSGRACRTADVDQRVRGRHNTALGAATEPSGRARTGWYAGTERSQRRSGQAVRAFVAASYRES